MEKTGFKEVICKGDMMASKIEKEMWKLIKEMQREMERIRDRLNKLEVKVFGESRDLSKSIS